MSKIFCRSVQQEGVFIHVSYELYKLINQHVFDGFLRLAMAFSFGAGHSIVELITESYALLMSSNLTSCFIIIPLHSHTFSYDE